jgi:arylsulfatase A-like enzyme
MAGKYPARMATTDWFGAPQPETVESHWTREKPLLPAPYVDNLPLEEISLAEAFRAGGYRTFFAGKWHLGGEGFYPEDQGFDINKGGWQYGGPWGGNKYFSPYGNEKLEDGPEGEHLPDRLADETVQFITENADGPFFACLSFYSVHTPLMTRPDLEVKYSKKSLSAPEEVWGTEGDREVRLVQNHAVYAGMIESMDEAVGKVLGKLEELDIADRTIVVFMSDNGGLSTSEGHPTSNIPLRAGKGWLYEGGIREPMMIKWPGVTRPGSSSDHPVTSTDFYPTLLEISGIPLNPEQHIDGISLASLLRTNQAPDRERIFWHYPHYGNQGGSPGSAVRSGDWKLIHFFEDDRMELYNVVDDIGETENRASEEPALVDSLRSELNVWRDEVSARYPTPRTNSE